MSDNAGSRHGQLARARVAIEPPSRGGVRLAASLDLSHRPRMKRADVAGFVERRWDLVEDEKLVARAELYRREGPLGCVRVSDALSRAIPREGWEERRAEDLRAHIRLRMLLDRIAEREGRRR